MKRLILLSVTICTLISCISQENPYISQSHLAGVFFDTTSSQDSSFVQWRNDTITTNKTYYIRLGLLLKEHIDEVTVNIALTENNISFSTDTVLSHSAKLDTIDGNTFILSSFLLQTKGNHSAVITTRLKDGTIKKDSTTFFANFPPIDPSKIIPTDTTAPTISLSPLKRPLNNFSDYIVFLPPKVYGINIVIEDTENPINVNNNNLIVDNDSLITLVSQMKELHSSQKRYQYRLAFPPQSMQSRNHIPLGVSISNALGLEKTYPIHILAGKPNLLRFELLSHSDSINYFPSNSSKITLYGALSGDLKLNVYTIGVIKNGKLDKKFKQKLSPRERVWEYNLSTTDNTPSYDLEFFVKKDSTTLQRKSILFQRK